MSRHVFLLGAALCLIALAFAVTDHVLGPQPGVTEANVKRIRKGMTEKEVSELLGRPPDARHVPPGYQCFHGLIEDVIERTIQYHGVWNGPSGSVTVPFNLCGKALTPSFERATGPALLQRLRAWLVK
jgi:hypothetical protein